ncbi:uncharacterized protein LOC144903175 isoform X4 [Branchiostoma floridae x Branchiostoma belcheri]
MSSPEVRWPVGPEMDPRLNITTVGLALVHILSYVMGNGVNMPTPTKVEGIDGETVILPSRFKSNVTKLIALTWTKAAGHLGRSREPVFMYAPPSANLSLGRLKGRAELTDNGSLQINPVSLDDEGIYILTTLLDGVGQEETYVELEIHVPPKVTLSQPSRLKLLWNSNLTLNCSIEKAKPEVAAIQWAHDGVDINSSATYTRKDSITGALLLFNGLRKEDSGTYTCRADHVVQQASDSVELEVLYPAQIVNISGDQIVHVSETATLWCMAEGNPDPNITWFRMGDDQSSAMALSEARGNGVNLVLRNPQQNDSGEYACMAGNGVGPDDSKFVKFTVREPQRIQGNVHPPFEIPQHFLMIAAGAGGGVLFVFLVFVAALACRGRSKKRVPSNCQLVTINPPLHSSRGNRIFARAKSDYTPKEENELQLHVADVVQILSTENNGWYFGYLHGRMGLFPANCVEIIKFDSRKPNKQPIPHDSHIQRHHNNRNRNQQDENLKRFARALYDYYPQEEGELHLQVDDVIEIVNRDDSGWWYGRTRGKEGLFPANYVEVTSLGGDLEVEPPGQEWNPVFPSCEEVDATTPLMDGHAPAMTDPDQEYGPSESDGSQTYQHHPHEWRIHPDRETSYSGGHSREMVDLTESGSTSDYGGSALNGTDSGKESVQSWAETIKVR